MAVQIDGTTGIDKVQDSIITTSKIADNNVTADKLPSGSVVGMAQVSSTAQLASTTNYGSANRYTINTINYTPKLSSSESKLIISWETAHGVGPKHTNLDNYGFVAGLEIDGTVETQLQHDVFPAGYTVTYTYGPEWFTTMEAGTKESTQAHTAGTPVAIKQVAWNDSNGGTLYINRCHSTSGSRGRCSLKVYEVKL